VIIRRSAPRPRELGVTLWHLFRDGLDPAHSSDGWAARTLVRSLRNVFLFALAAMHLLVLGSLASALGTLSASVLVALVALHVLAVTTTLLCVSRARLAGAVIVLTYVVAAAELVAAVEMDTAPVLAAVWLLHLAAAVPAVLLVGRPALVAPVVGSLAVAVCVGVRHPTWLGVFAAMPVAAALIVIGLRCGLGLLVPLARRVDQLAEGAARQSRATAWTQAAARSGAERRWVLHDTVINTLGAIARGGAAVRDPSLVRDRCAHDGAVVRALLAGEEELLLGDRGPSVVLTQSPLRVRYTGLPAEAVEQAAASLPAGQWAAVGRAMQEVLRNVQKHAGVHEVTVDAELVRGDLCLTVVDAGRGFDPDAVEWRGLAGSVMERCRAAGVEIDVRSSPGDGTAVRFRMGMVTDEAARRRRPRAVIGLVRNVRRRAVWAAAVGVLVVSLILESADRPGELNGTHLAIAVAASFTALTWRMWRRHPLPQWWSIVLAIAAGAVFVLSLQTSDFGADRPTQLKAAAPAGLLILAVVLSRWRPMIWVVGLGYVATGVATAILLTNGRPEAIGVVMVACMIGVFLSVGVLGFDLLLERLGARAESDHAARSAAAAEAAAIEAAEHSRTQWREVGLQRALVMLDALASGELKPDDADVQARCGEVEAQLRELIRLDPALVQLGPWLLRSLAQAHESGGRLVVRTGSEEPDDPHLIAGLGAMLVDAVSGIRPGEQMIASLHRVGERLVFTVVAPHPRLIGLGSGRLPESTAWGVETFAGQDLLQVVARR